MNKIFKSVAVVTIFATLTRLLSFIFKMFLSKAYGAETVGLYQICLSVLLLLLSLSIGGFPTVLSRKIAEAEVAGNYKKQNAYLCATLTIGFFISATIIAICFLMRSYLNYIFADSRASELFLIMLPALLTSTLYCSIRAWFWGKKKFFAFSFTELLEEILKILFTLLFSFGIVASISGATAIAIAFTIADAICALVLIIMFFISGGRLAKPSGTKSLIKSSAPLTTLRVSTSLVASLTAIVIPLMLAESNGVALYGQVSGMAMPLITAPTTIIGSLAVVLIPEMAKANVQSDKKTINSNLSYSLLFSTFICSMAFMLFTPLGEELGILLFGDKGAGKYVAYCSSLMFLVGINQTTTPVLNSLGLEGKTLKSYIFGLIAFLPCIFFLPKVIGIYAVAVANAVMQLVCIIINFIILKKRQIKVDYKLKNVMLILATIPCIMLGYFVKGILTHYLTLFFVVLFTALICLIAYCIMVFGLKLVPIKLSFLKGKKRSKIAKIVT